MPVKVKCPGCGCTEFARTMTEIVEIEASTELLADNLVGQSDADFETEPRYECARCKRVLQYEEMKV